MYIVDTFILSRPSVIECHHSTVIVSINLEQ